jgi:uncharacterized protein
MLESAKKQKCNFTLYGGEPLLLPFADLEKVFKFGYDNFKQNGIQTNGVLITDRHFELFKKYNVSLGFSIDGPGELNSARSREVFTNYSIKNFYRALKEGFSVSLITTLTKVNCKPELIKWFSELDDMGLKNLNLHWLENDNKTGLNISQSEQIIFMGWLLEATERFKTLRCDTFTDMIKRLFTGAGGTCIFNYCDPYNTTAVQGIGPNGELHNCGRVNKAGVDFVKADDNYLMRTEALRNTEQAEGGCKGCKYFYACTGFCPGTGINGDWRNRTEHCETLKTIFGWLEVERIVVSVYNK